MKTTNLEQENKKKYLTLESGTDYRTIAKTMTSLGFKMNHATARNQLHVAIRSFLLNLSREAKGTKLKSSEIEELVLDQDVLNQLGEILYNAYHSDK